jgi:hypothetical protein
VFEEITLRDRGKGTRMTFVDLGYNTMIKYKNLYIMYIKSGTRREREKRERERVKIYNGLHYIKTELLKSITKASIYREAMSDRQVT